MPESKKSIIRAYNDLVATKGGTCPARRLLSAKQSSSSSTTRKVGKQNTNTMKPNTMLKSTLTAMCGLLLVTGCDRGAQKPALSAEAKTSADAQVADAIYFGGNIITVNDAQPSAEAVAVKGGKIVAVGTRAEVEQAQKGANTQ